MKKSFVKELLRRRVPQIVGSYIIASTSMILFIDWLSIRYEFPQEYITLALFGTISIFPSVIILSYFHGAPGKDEWTKVEKVGIPLNIIFILLVILFGDASNLWFNNNDKPNKFFIHITSDEKYIEDQYLEVGGLANGFDKNKYLITAISDSLLEQIHGKVFNNVITRFHNSNIQIETHETKEELKLLNRLSSPRIYLRALINLTKGYSKKEDFPTEKLDSLRKLLLSSNNYERFNDQLKKRIDFDPDGMFVVFLYRITSKETGNIEGIMNEIHHYKKDDEGRPYLPGSMAWNGGSGDINKLIEHISNKLIAFTYLEAIGPLKVGRVVKLLEKDMVKIQLYEGQIIKKNMILEHWVSYKWLKDGYEKRIEDIELALNYYQNNPNEFDSLKCQQLFDELEGIKNGTGRNRGEHAYSSDMKYVLQVIDVMDDVVIAKIISKEPPYMKVRPGDKIRINFFE